MQSLRIQFGSILSSSLGSTIAAPTLIAPKISYTDKSKLTEEIPITLSIAPKLTYSLTANIVFIAASCLIATPLGVPVEPDVYMIYASDSRSTFTSDASASYASAS